MFVAGRAHTFLPAHQGRYRGHRFDGDLHPTQAEVAGHLARWDIDDRWANVISAVAAMEGGFDSIQTYDVARFSWGFIQFTAIGGLPGLMGCIREEAPDLYDQHFVAAGIDAAQGTMIVRRGDREWRRWRAINLLHDDPTLWRPFLLAARDPLVQSLQVRAAHDAYLKPALRCQIVVDGEHVPLGDLLADHPMGPAILMDHVVHRGVTYTAKLFQRAAANASTADAVHLIDAARALEPGDQVRWVALERAMAG